VSSVGARQVSRRSMVVCGALVVRPDSSVFTPQELAGKLVALDYGNGTAYAGWQMLEGAVPRAGVTTRALFSSVFGSTTVTTPDLRLRCAVPVGHQVRVR